jgi:hypothetical protein
MVHLLTPQILLPRIRNLTTSTPGRTTFIHPTLPSTNRHNFFSLAKAKVIEHVVPSSLIAVAADDGGLALSFPPDPLLQYSSNIGVRIRAVGLVPSHPRVLENNLLSLLQGTYLVLF